MYVRGYLQGTENGRVVTIDSAINNANEWDKRNHKLNSSTFVFKNVNFYSTKNVYVTYIIYTISICFLIIDKLYYLFLVLALFGTNLLKLILAEKIDHTEQGILYPGTTTLYRE